MLSLLLYLNVLRVRKYSLLIAIILNLFGCADQENPEIIRFGLSTDPVTLDPRYATDAVSDRIVRLIYTRLVDFDEYFQVQPLLATWENLDQKHYRFTLKDQFRTFHDGRRLTSQDVRASYASVLDSATASPHRTSLHMIERIETPDPDTVDFYLNQADPLFPGRLVLGILPAHLLSTDHPFNHLPIGSGPLRMNKWSHTGDLTLQRISDDQIIEFITVKDPTVRALKLVRGELDLFQGDVPGEMLKWLDEQAEVKISKSRGSTFSYLGFNLADPVLGQLEVRKAIACALDREEIIHYVFQDVARLANAILPPEHWAGHDELTANPEDCQVARARLRTLGYDEHKPLQINYKTSNNPFRMRLATVIQDQLKQAGMTVEIQSLDWGTFYGDIKSGRFQMYSLSWVGLKLPDIFRYVFHSESIPPEGANRGRYSDPLVDKWIEEAEIETDLARQAEYYRQLQVYLLDQLPYVPLWFEDNVLIQRKGLQGYQQAADGNYDGLITIRNE